MSNKIAEIKKIINGQSESADKAASGAFAHSDTVLFTLRIPRYIGAVSVKMKIWKDAYSNESKTQVKEFYLNWCNISDGCDIYNIKISFPEILGDEAGLFYYHYKISTSCGDTIFPEMADAQLLLYENEYKTPGWIKGGIIYHIFVDRFRKAEVSLRGGAAKCKVKEYAVINKDWNNGIPQYGEYPGADVKNNVFFGGNLYGIIEKLDYIESLGANCIYLSPVFDAYSNHKYDTGDYLTVDSMFGGDRALEKLITEAEKHGIKIILDGVFNHTGSDSVYFNMNGTYNSVGAYQSRDSRYYKWYRFRQYPDDYESWWGVKILPRLDCDETSYKDFIFEQVIEKWMNMGINGFRLDVADELSDKFLQELRKKIKSKNPEAVIIGEVWEDASNKISYGQRRKYLWGNELDSVMNYPLREAIISYIRDGDFHKMRQTTEQLYFNYPKQSADMLMNIIGTHDTERIMTVLAGEETGSHTNEELSVMKMTPEQREKGKKLLKLSYAILISMPGVPCIFYGDETGMEGYRDPFCRRPYPWNHQDEDLIQFYIKLGQIRRKTDAFSDGSYKIIICDENIFAFIRKNENQTILTAVNRSDNEYEINADCTFFDLIEEKRTINHTLIKPMSSPILRVTGEVDKIIVTPS